MNNRPPAPHETTLEQPSAPVAPDTHQPSPQQPANQPAADEASLVVNQPRFALVPEWVIDAKIPDSSFRLYSLLLRYGATSGNRMPSRATLARRLQRSVDAVDRAMKGLVDAGIVTVERRRNGAQNLTNRYYLATQPPALREQPTQQQSGRTSAATPTVDTVVDSGLHVLGGHDSAATPSRESAAGVAAEVRPDPKSSTQSTTPPPPTPPARQSTARPGGRAEGVAIDWLLADCGIAGPAALADLTAKITSTRQALGKPTTRWSQHCLTAALQLAVRGRGWPAEMAVPALLEVAADPQTNSPMRLAEGGPWWDRLPARAAAPTTPEAAAELAAMEERLAETDGRRAALQASARKELAAEGQPLTRTTVVRRACQILDRKGQAR
ncbi:helix-turn-helix domain-containing protein [Kineococcus sp. SYSU DK003]|uniref:helix-turn-helix domain-containing protein n=1 Tax=Kineococcus sp. SYSU DK003 TaxID=3383124 RepID=UPI003D7DEBD8